MKVTLRRSGRSGKSDPGAASSAPRASRLRSPRWADVRLWVGIALVVASMFAGARLLSHGSDTITVWQAQRDLSVGSTEWNLRPVSVDLGPAVTDYIPVTEQPTGSLRFPVAAGELLPRSAVAVAGSQPTRTVTVGVDPLHAPIELRAGDVVDMWSTPTPSAGAIDGVLQPQLVLAGVSVEQVGDGGMGGQLAVALRVEPERVTEVVQAARAGTVDLVAVPLADQGVSFDDDVIAAEAS